MDTTQSVEMTAKPRGWPLFLAGFLLFLIGPAVYFVAFSMARLTTPWYLPILSTLGVLLMTASLVRRFGILRSIGLAFFMLFCGLQWFMFLVISLNPTYQGPAPGVAIPAFDAKLADGSTFSNADLEDGKPAVLVFYRGHW